MRLYKFIILTNFLLCYNFPSFSSTSLGGEEEKSIIQGKTYFSPKQNFRDDFSDKQLTTSSQIPHIGVKIETETKEAKWKTTWKQYWKILTPPLNNHSKKEPKLERIREGAAWFPSNSKLRKDGSLLPLKLIEK